MGSHKKLTLKAVSDKKIKFFFSHKKSVKRKNEKIFFCYSPRVRDSEGLSAKIQDIFKLH